MIPNEPFAEGWWLMSVPQLERYLAAWHADDPTAVPEGIDYLSTEEALAYRNEGNVPDAADRSLRLVLRVHDAAALRSLDSKRLVYEPDVHEPPTWRRDGSRPINVVPLRATDIDPASDEVWWEDATMAEMESEWQRTGRVDGIVVPEPYRGFVYKTVAALRAAGEPVSVDAIADSVARWLAPNEVDELRASLRAANNDG